VVSLVVWLMLLYRVERLGVGAPTDDAAGIRTDRVVWTAAIIAGLLAALAGIIESDTHGFTSRARPAGRPALGSPPGSDVYHPETSDV
jgi:ABC-type uncharacterized transport system permease subunit